MERVIIIPTEETSWGIDDKYNIKSGESDMILHENISQESLVDIVSDNNYEVISGERHL